MAELPFDPGALSPEDEVIYEAMVAKRKSQGAGFGGPYAALMNHPKLCQKIEDLGYYLKFEGHLPRDVYQFVVLAVAFDAKTGFIWADHVQHALDAGMPEPVVETLKSGGVFADNFPKRYRTAARVLQATLRWQNIPDDAQADAIHAYTLLGFIELVVVSGFYQMFAAINQGFAVSLPKGISAPW